jgi:hypothetical protein
VKRPGTCGSLLGQVAGLSETDVSTLHHPRNLAGNKQRNGVGNRAGIITSLPLKKKNIVLDSGLFQRPDLQPETKTELQPRSHWPRLIVRARATDTRSRGGAKDSEQHARLFVHHRTRREGGKPKENRAKNKKEKNVFLITSLDSAVRSSSYNGGQQQERGTVVMDKTVSLSRSFSSQFGVGSKEKPIVAAGASESKRWIKRKHFGPFSLLFYLFAPFSSSLCLFLPAQ